MIRTPILPIFINQAGCPRRCVFCNQRVSGGEPLELPEIAGRIAAQAANFPPGPLEIAFFGGSFTLLPQQLQFDLFSTVIRSLAPRKLLFRISTRPDALALPVLSTLAELGLHAVELGVQSMNDRILELLGRGHTAADVRDGVATLRRAGLAVVLQLMYGLPHEPPSAALRSAAEAASLRSDGVRLHPTVVLDGSELAEWTRLGRFRPLSLEAAVRVGARLLLLFRKNGIPVLRLGLQANDLLLGGRAAGPYHPAMRSLAESELCRWRLLAALKKIGQDPPSGPGRTGVTLVIHCNSSEIHYWTGHARSNRAFLKTRFSADLKLIPDLPVGDEAFLELPGDRRLQLDL